MTLRNYPPKFGYLHCGKHWWWRIWGEEGGRDVRAEVYWQGDKFSSLGQDVVCSMTGGSSSTLLQVLEIVFVFLLVHGTSSFIFSGYKD